MSGSYTVQLPDGRVQTVKYTADDYTGYVADVTVSIYSTLYFSCLVNNFLWQYEGQAVYPEVKPYKPVAI